LWRSPSPSVEVVVTPGAATSGQGWPRLRAGASG
jgi:hypothetical protein